MQPKNIYASLPYKESEKRILKRNSRKFTLAEHAILTTILYSDIFSFPLTRNELWNFLISKEKISQKEFTSGLQTLEKYITAKDGYLCLKNREEIIVKRKQHLAEVSQKMKLAQRVCTKLSKIPSILLIGISGGLAVGNVTAHDDIDLVIIVKKNTLFMSRLLILTVLEGLGVRRYRKQTRAADTICANLLFDETAYGWFSKNKDIYTAREIAQIKPLFEREGVYQQFMHANKWIENVLPNITVSKLHTTESLPSKQNSGRVLLARMTVFNPLFESFSRVLQMSWMKQHQTTETVTKHILAFHPNDYRAKTMEKLKLKMQELGLLTNF